MIINVFDTETTGFVQDKQPDSSPNQAHMVQLAMVLFDTKARVCLKKISVIVKCPVDVPEQVASIHGISTETKDRFGIQPKSAFGLFKHFCMRADRLVAHNKSFDLKVLRVLGYRVEEDCGFLDSKESVCTMEMSRAIVNMPATEKMLKSGLKGPKAPKLSEAYRYFYGEELIGAHDALIDTEACARIYMTLLDQGVIQEGLL
jgi:DNA polymerase III subunit epsilon